MEKQTVAVVGLGYVGLPIALLCKEKGHTVFGLELDQKKVDLINKNKSPIDDPYIEKKIKTASIKASTKPEETLPNADTVLICVPTPVDEEYIPNLNPLLDAAETVAKHAKKDALIVVESTIFPGTVEELIVPIFTKNGFKEPLLAHCPERIDPGNKRFTVDNLPRVVGGISKAASQKAKEFYQNIINADVLELSSVKAAEATKIMENTFRDINIAFINEMARSFDKAGIDILEVIKGASTKPFAFMPHYPGVGVGGHCIPVDPYYLIQKAKMIGFDHKFLTLARQINQEMPLYTVQLLEQQLGKNKASINGAKIGVLGVAYKANVDDMRESPALDVIDILKSRFGTVEVFDPHIPGKSTVQTMNELLKKCDYLVLATDHDEFKKLTGAELQKNTIKGIVDGRNCLNGEDIKKSGIHYHGIGKS